MVQPVRCRTRGVHVSGACLQRARMRGVLPAPERDGGGAGVQLSAVYRVVTGAWTGLDGRHGKGGEGMLKKGWGWLAAALLTVAWPAGAQTVVKYVHTDTLGSVVLITDEGRNVLERREYEPYGAQLVPAVQDGPGYTGHVQDAATGLVYMQQRYYDSGLGVFLSVDPVIADRSSGANFNRYRYSINNPYTFYDPDGKKERKKVTGSNIPNGRGFAGGSVIGAAGQNISPNNIQERANAAQRYIDAVGPTVESKVRDTPTDSARLFGRFFQAVSFRLGLEFGANIIPSEISLEGWQIRNIVFSRYFSNKTGVGYDVIISNEEFGYDVHTHPYGSRMSHWFSPFSSSDVKHVGDHGINMFVSDPEHGLFFMAPGSLPEKIE